MWVLLGPRGVAHWNPSPGSHLLCIPFIIMCLRRNHPWVYMLRYSFHFPLVHSLASGTFLFPPLNFLFFWERAPPPGLSLGLSLVVFLLALCSASPAFSWDPGLRMLQVSWKLPGNQAHEESRRAFLGSEGMDVWDCKALGSKGRGRPPHFHRALLCFAFLVSLVPVGC